ncbi:hypothetical protein ACXWTF_12880 [Thiomicrolovo sp. ZZH C-3]
MTYVIAREDRQARTLVHLMDFTNRPKRFGSFIQAEDFLLRMGVPAALIGTSDYKIVKGAPDAA